MPLIPKHRDAADADGDGPGGAHQQARHQLCHVAAVVERMYYRYIPGTFTQLLVITRSKD